MYFEITQTIAEVAGTLIGFVGVVFVLGGRALRTLTPAEKSGMLHLLIGSVGTLLIAFITMIMLASLGSYLAWKISATICAVYAFSGSAKAISEELAGVHNLPKPFNWGLPIMAITAGVFDVLAVTNVVQNATALASICTMLLGLVVAVTYFVNLLTGYHDFNEGA